MKSLMKKTGIYLLAFIVAVVSPGCTTTQPVASEPPANTIQQNNNESESETSQAQENQAGTVPEENTTEGAGVPAVVEVAGKAVMLVLGSALFLLFLGLGSAGF